MSQNAIVQDFSKTRESLGGTEEDLKLIQDADFSGSEFEDESKSTDVGLKSDVEKIWAELTQDNKGKKTKFDERSQESTQGKQDARKDPKRDAKDTKGDTKMTKKDTKDTKDTKKDPKESKKEPKKEPKKESKDSKDSKDSSVKPTQLMVKPSGPTVKPLPTIIPKKDRLAWSDFIKTIHHTREKLLVDDTKPWFEIADKYSPNSGSDVQPKVQYTADILHQLKAQSEQVLYVENSLYFEQRSKDRDFGNSLEFLKNGTYSDKLGTLSLLCTESPLHTMKFMENLFSNCEIKNRESACRAVEVFKDLVGSHILPDRKLKHFKDQPLSPDVPLEVIVCWAFEDFVKTTYFKLLQIMEKLLTDNVESIRLRTMLCVFDLLQKKPEQEANLLRLGLNKFGDPSGRVSSRLKNVIMDLLQVHPGMKFILASAIGDLLRGTSDYRVRFYAVDTLSEFILSRKEPELANQLIHIYLNLFEMLLTESKNKVDVKKEPEVSAGKPKTGSRFRPKRGKKGGIKQEKLDENEAEYQRHSSLVSKIFTGLNRAFPFSNLDASMFVKHTNTLYQMSHSPNVSTLIESLSFIFQLLKSSPQIGADRFFKALYESLLDDRLMHSSKLGKYIILLLRSTSVLNGPDEITRACAFIKRVLQIAVNWSEIGAAACLIHVASLNPHLSGLLSEQELEQEQESQEPNGQSTSDGELYDMKQRDPRFAKAETSKAWELVLLERHYHPTVALYASNAMASANEKKQLDMPDIDQYSANNFLSKWSYKNPKAKDTGRGNSIFQPLSGFTDISLGIRQANTELSDLPASMQDWKTKRPEDILPEDRFLYNYFIQKPDKKVKEPKESKESKGQSEHGEDNSDMEDDDSANEGEIDEDEINAAITRSAPGEYGEDIDLAGMDDDDESDGDDDLEDGLAAAFATSSDEGDDAGSDDDVADDDAADDDELIKAFGDDEFAQFDEAPEEQKPETEKDDGKKRKRKWNSLPTFLDADSFDQMYGDGSSSKKTKQ